MVQINMQPIDAFGAKPKPIDKNVKLNNNANLDNTNTDTAP